MSDEEFKESFRWAQGWAELEWKGVKLGEWILGRVRSRYQLPFSDALASTSFLPACSVLMIPCEVAALTLNLQINLPI